MVSGPTHGLGQQSEERIMSNVLRLAIVDPSDSARDSLKTMLLGMDMVWLEAECSRYEFFADVVTQTHPDIGIVALDKDPDKALQLVEQLGQAAPNVQRAGGQRFDRRDADLAGDAGRGERIPPQAGADRRPGRRAGADSRAPFRPRRDRNRAAAGDHRVCGATGGVGTTSLAVNLGCALAKDPKNSVVLVDLDLCLGDADVFLDTIPDYTLVDVAQNVTRLDFTLLKRSLTKHSSGLFLLPRPVQLEDVKLITPEDLQRVIGLLKATFTHLVIDLSKTYSPLDMVALEMANHVLLVTQLDLPCLRNVVRLMMSFGEIDGMKDKIKIVVNRAGSGQRADQPEKGPRDDRPRYFLAVAQRVSHDGRGAQQRRAADRAGPKAPITQSIMQLAEALAGEPKEAEEAGPSKAEKPRWLKFLGSKAKG